MSTVWLVVCVVIAGSIIHAVNNFRKYINMRNHRDFPKNNNHISPQNGSDKSLARENGNSLAPIADVLTNGNGKVHHGEVGFFNPNNSFTINTSMSPGVSIHLFHNFKDK